jgi:hypothetical protein
MATALAGVYQLRQAKTQQRKQRAPETGPLIPHAPELQPRPNEAVIDRITMSAFEGRRWIASGRSKRGAKAAPLPPPGGVGWVPGRGGHQDRGAG